MKPHTSRPVVQNLSGWHGTRTQVQIPQASLPWLVYTLSLQGGAWCSARRPSPAQPKRKEQHCHLRWLQPAEGPLRGLPPSCRRLRYPAQMGPGGITEWRSFDTADGLYDCVWSEENENILVSASGDGSIKVRPRQPAGEHAGPDLSTAALMAQARGVQGGARRRA